jgi:putative membrane protein
MTFGPRFMDEDEQPTKPVVQSGSVVPVRAPIEEFARPVLFDEEPGTLDSLPDPPAMPNRHLPPVRTGTGLLVAWGIGGLIVSWVAFSLVSFVLTQFQTSQVLGIFAGLFLAASVGLLVWAVVIEVRAWRALAEVDRLRRVLSANLAEQSAVLAAGREWLALVASHLPDSAQIEGALKAATSTAEVRALLRTRIADPLEARALQLGQRAALECAALIAVSPHNSWDGLIAGARGLRLIRQVAALYGVRPGFAVTVSMARHVAWTAAGTAGAAMLAENLVSTAAEAPVLKHIARVIGGSVVEAIRIVRLARVAARSCSPLDA